jgi:formylglycine-generating enzyme required for sulfatase activity
MSKEKIGMRKVFTVLFVCTAVGVFAQQNTVSDEFVLINGGTFTMGSPANEPGRDNGRDRETQHQVTVSSFYMGKYEVTQKEYEEIMGTNPAIYHKGDNMPVQQVNWFAAIEYCNNRSQKEGLTPAYTINGANVTWDRNANGYRLPTEAEWEYACRAGTTTAYNTGDTISDNTGWYSSNSKSAAHAVGQKPPNAWGLYDMHGNVAEWCWDNHLSYSSGAQTNPTTSLTKSGSQQVVIRGGDYSHSAAMVRSAYRGANASRSGFPFIGFRLVRS